MRKKASLNLHAIRSSVMRSINVQCTCMSSMGVDLILCGVCMQADTCLCRCLHFLRKNITINDNQTLYRFHEHTHIQTIATRVLATNDG